VCFCGVFVSVCLGPPTFEDDLYEDSINCY